MNRKRTLLLGIVLMGLLSLSRGSSAQTVPETAPNGSRVSIWNLAVSPAANIMTYSLTSTSRGGAAATTYLMVMAIASTASDSVIYFNVSNPGDATPSQNFVLNSGNPLSAGYAFSFEFPASAPFLYNFQTAVATKIGYMDIDRKVN